jgi:ribonuclease HI
MGLVRLDRPEVRRFHLETDASLNPHQRQEVEGWSLQRAGGGIVVRTPAMVAVGMYTVPLGFLPSAVVAEALALLRGMMIARKRHGATFLRARNDSALLVDIVSGRAAAFDPTLLAVVERVAEERDRFEGFQIRWSKSSHAHERQPGVPTADALARKAAGLSQR